MSWSYCPDCHCNMNTTWSTILTSLSTTSTNRRVALCMNWQRLSIMKICIVLVTELSC